MLKVSGLWKRFGKLYALKDVNIDFREGELKIIIGPNGAGKTTLVNVISGVLRESAGIIKLDNKVINKLPKHARARLGIGRTFQIPQPFPNLTVFENIKISSLFIKKMSQNEAEAEVERIIKLLGLTQLTDTLANELNTEEMKLVDLGRALAGNPKYLFIDEMGAGLSEGEIINLSKLIKYIKNKENISIIYIGHVMRMVKELESDILVLAEGTPIYEGTYDEVISNKKVIELYLGEKYARG